MPDYQCQCKGPFGTARYTVKEASAKDFRCPICNTQIVEVKNTPVGAEHYTVIDDDDVQIAPGVNANDERFSDAMRDMDKRVDEIIERHADKETSRTLNDVREKIGLERVPDGDVKVSNTFPALRMDGKNVQFSTDKGLTWKTLYTTTTHTPDVRIRYAHGIEYAFGWEEIETPGFKTQLIEFSESWTARKNAALTFKARGRMWLLNAELVAGIDFLVN